MNTRKGNKQSDLSVLAEEAQALIAATSDVAVEKVQQARERLSDYLAQAKSGAREVYETATEASKRTGQFVRHNPYQSVAIGVLAGICIGMLLSRCD
jgi:ElaB/YqjD/DUF883 family membrane-anchored ribosome-binding protein